jgi:hypothetical protein
MFLLPTNSLFAAIAAESDDEAEEDKDDDHEDDDNDQHQHLLFGNIAAPAQKKNCQIYISTISKINLT